MGYGEVTLGIDADALLDFVLQEGEKNPLAASLGYLLTDISVVWEIPS